MMGLTYGRTKDGSSNNSDENVTMVERVFSINEVKERMKQCIVNAIYIVDGVCPL